MRRLWRKGITRNVGDEPGLLDAGRYRVPVLEQTYGLASQDSVVFSRGNERVWELLDLTFDSIRASSDSTDTKTAVADLKAEDYKLVGRRAGEALPAEALPAHPSVLFEEFVADAIVRCLPEAKVDAVPERATADLQVSYKGQTILAEVKWRSDLAQPFAASTLSRVIDGLPEDSKLLVVVCASALPTGDRFIAVQEAIGGRGKVVPWQSPKDDARLRDALEALLPVNSKTS
jgi:hypothetical protein